MEKTRFVDVVGHTIVPQSEDHSRYNNFPVRVESNGATGSIKRGAAPRR